MRKLDRIDHQILDILQRDGRIAISELASRVNLSTTPCSERVKRLERDGIIMGYYARLNPELVNRSLLVFLEIKYSNSLFPINISLSSNLNSFLNLGTKYISAIFTLSVIVYPGK